MNKPNVLVVGSINMDLVSYSERIPQVGETVLGQRFVTVPGGKGANQALAAARLGAQVTLLGAAGLDNYGEELLKHLQQNGVDVSLVQRVPTSTGVALINVDAQGNNQIVVIPGANFTLQEGDLEKNQQAFAKADIVVLQLEVPLSTVGKALELAALHKKPVILNPAPAQPIPTTWLSKIAYLVPNEHEVQLISGHSDDFYAELRQQLNGTLVVTQGERGVSYAAKEQMVQKVPAFPVQAIDSTAAGDAFIGGMSVALAEGFTLQEAIRFASAGAALSVTRQGAQTSLPLRKEVEDFLEDK